MAFFLPNIASDLIRDTFHAKCIFDKVALDVTDFCEPIESCGASITLPVVNALTSASDFDWSDSTEAISFQDLATTDKTANIKTAAKGVSIRDKELIQSKGMLQEVVLTDMARVMAEAVDNDCATQILTDCTNTHTTSSLCIGDIWDLFGDFGANVSSDSFAGIIASGKLYPKLVALESFVSAEKTFNRFNENGVVNSEQCVGYLNNVPIYLSDATGMWNSTQSKAKLILIKKGALASVYQRQPVYEEDRNLAKLRTELAASMYYATKLVFPAQASVLTVNFQ